MKKTPPLLARHVSGALLPLLVVTFSFSVDELHAAAVSWTAGGGGNTVWSSSANWNGTPGGNDVIFGDPGKSASTQTGNTVDQNFTLGSLSYQQSGAGATDYQVTEIASGVTLTLDGSTFVSGSGTALNVGEASANPTNTLITGAGSLVIDQTLLGKSLDVAVGTTGAAATGTAELDLSGLETFAAKVNAFNIGSGQYSVGTVRLAKNSAIEAASVTVGNSGNTNFPGNGALYLGNQTTLNTATITVAGGKRGIGLLAFDPGLDPSAASVTIRGVTDFIVARNAGNGAATGGYQTGMVDFGGGTVDVEAQNLTLGAGQGVAGGGAAIGTVKMAAGTFAVNSAILGQSVAGSAASSDVNTGTVAVGGGRFEVETLTLAEANLGSQGAEGNLSVSGGVVEVGAGGVNMGRKVGGTGAGTSNLTLTGGLMGVNGDIVTGTGGMASHQSTINLRGGALDLKGHSVTVDSFNAQSGELKNLGALTVGGASPGLTKSGAGVLTLSGSNAFAGGIAVNGGVLHLESNALPGTGNVAVNKGGSVAFAGTGAQAALAANRVDGASAGSLALTAVQAGENLDFSASGANLANVFLGAFGDIRYTGALTNFDAGSYKLGGGQGTLVFDRAISGAASLEIGGDEGSTVVPGENNTHTGGTKLSGGTLRISSTGNLGASGNALSFDGGTLQWAEGSAADFSDGRTVTIGAGGAGLDTNGNEVTLQAGIGNGGAGGLTKKGSGTLTLPGVNSYTGATTVNEGTLTADLSVNTTGVIQAASALALNGGTFEAKGAASGNSSQTLGNLSLAAGTASGIVIDGNGGTSTTLNLGSWTRGTAGTLHIDLSSGGAATAVLHSSPTLTNGVVPYAVLTDGSGVGFAAVDGNGNVTRAVLSGPLPVNKASGDIALTNYWTSGVFANGRAKTVNSLILDTTSAAGSMNLALGQLGIASGGVLMVGSHDYEISGGLLGSVGVELMIHQYGSGVLTVGGSLANGTAAMVKTGPGTLVFTEEKTYTGETYVNEGLLQVDGALASETVHVGRDAALSGTGSLEGDVALKGNSTVSSAGTLHLKGTLSASGLGNTVSGGTLSVALGTQVAANASLTVDQAATLSGNGGVIVGGLLNGGGTVDKEITVQRGGRVTGTLTTGRIGGSGSVDPGNSPGLLTATGVDPSDGLAFNLEFTAKNSAPNWPSLANDVLRLTGTTPFVSSLTSMNVISLYLSDSLFTGLTGGDFLAGGFYTDSGDFLGAMQNATLRVLRQDDAGSILYNGQFYSIAPGASFSISTQSDPQFGGSGYLARFDYEAVPEPKTGLLLLLTGGVLLVSGRRFRAGRCR